MGATLKKFVFPPPGNACGLFYVGSLICRRQILLTRVPIAQKLHGVVRPLSLKTDVIKKRCAISRALGSLSLKGWLIMGMTLIFQEPSFRRAKFGCAQEQPWASEARLVLDTAALIDDE